MNHILKFAVAALITLVAMHGQVDAAVVDVYEGSTNGYTMANGNTYVIRDSVAFSNAMAGGSGMTVEDEATVVLYIPTGITLTARGADGVGRIGAGAGISVPSNSTLIVTGEGTINATGGNAGNGENGADGADGGSISYYTSYSVGGSVYYGMTGLGYSGEGGKGGDGGGGAAAGIGGCGSNGGAGGLGGGARFGYGPTALFSGNGANGNNGSPGETSPALGCLYVLGKSTILAESGKEGCAGLAGTNGNRTCYQERDRAAQIRLYHYWVTSGGGGGGGGGAGCAPVCDIGGGGASSGGGGGGGSGATAGRERYELPENAHGGGGTGGISASGNGGVGNAKGTSVSAIGDCSGGDGGKGGASGAVGDPGTPYVSPTATVNVEREMLSATTHSAAQYTITFDACGGQHSTSVTSLVATLGCELPDCISAPTRYC